MVANNYRTPESGRSCTYVLDISVLPISMPIFLLHFGAVHTVWYFWLFILFSSANRSMYIVLVIGCGLFWERHRSSPRI